MSLLCIIAVSNKLSRWLPSRSDSHSREMTQIQRIGQHRERDSLSRSARDTCGGGAGGAPLKVLLLLPSPASSSLRQRRGGTLCLRLHVQRPGRFCKDTKCLQKLNERGWRWWAVSCRGRRRGYWKLDCGAEGWLHTRPPPLMSFSLLCTDSL